VQRIHAVFFRQGAQALGEGTLRGTEGLAAARAAAAAHLSPAGQRQVATALAMMACLEDQMHALRHQLLHAARHLQGAKVLAGRLYGVGPLTALALTCRPVGAGRFSSARKAVRFTGLDITVHSSDGKGPPGRLSRQGPPAAALGPLRGRQGPRPRLRPRPRLLRGRQGPQERQARHPVRGPQDHPPGLPHPGRARRGAFDAA
jgi:transposase